MARALCHGCVEDYYLSKIISNEGTLIKCSVCGAVERKAITVKRLGQIMEPIMREHFEFGPQIRKFGEDDKDWWEQDGDPISEAVQEVLGQYFDFDDEIVEAIVEADDYWPPDGEEAYWDTTNLYVPTRVRTEHYLADWHNTLLELKHGRRFFSPSSRALFEKLFDGIDDLRAKKGDRLLPVARVLPKGTSIYRARICNSRAMLKSIFTDPIQELGPPPSNEARAGRMNAEGVVVLYAARDLKTCLAEMRPALGCEIAVIEMKTTQALRVLDFSRLDEARSGKALSYFQNDFKDQVERRAFLRRLHSLISQPIVPGSEADYLITQTMAEYLAHVHDKPFDGILFSSVQRAGGMNIVLFPEKGLLTKQPAEAFRVKYVDNSIKLVSTAAIRYTHHELIVRVDSDGEPWVYDNLDLSSEEDWE
jgi:hypothetical protein